MLFIDPSAGQEPPRTPPSATRPPVPAPYLFPSPRSGPSGAVTASSNSSFTISPFGQHSMINKSVACIPRQESRIEAARAAPA